MRGLRYSLTALALFSGISAMAYEEPLFASAATINGVEYRQYDEYLVAETVVSGEADRDKAASIAFRRLFKYISGENSVRTELVMTTPVQQKPASTKIAMTTPVQQTSGTEGWIISFMVPDKFDEATAPRPTNPAVYLRKVPGQLVAVLRYSGRWTDRNVELHKSELLDRLSSAGVEPLGEVTTAFYNAPFSLPPMRRNEVMVVVREIPASSEKPAA